MDPKTTIAMGVLGQSFWRLNKEYGAGRGGIEDMCAIARAAILVAPEMNGDFEPFLHRVHVLESARLDAERDGAPSAPWRQEAAMDEARRAALVVFGRYMTTEEREALRCPYEG